MSFRNYIGYIPKREYNKIKSLSYDSLLNFYKIQDDYISLNSIVNKLYELGQYCEFDGTKQSKLPFFKKKNVNDIFNDDEEWYVVTKEFLSEIISFYQERVKTYYNDMFQPIIGSGFFDNIKVEYGIDTKYRFDFNCITDEQQTALYKIIEHVRSFRCEWNHITPFDLNEGEHVTTSWKYEYAIFELVRIYKTFDWKKNIMVYYGY